LCWASFASNCAMIQPVEKSPFGLFAIIATSLESQLVYNLLEVAWHDLADPFRIPGREAPSLPSPPEIEGCNFVANSSMPENERT